MKPGLICLGFFTKREYLFEIMYLYLIKFKQLHKYNQNWVDWHNFIAHINKLALTLKDNDSDKNKEQTKYNDTSCTNGTFGFARHTSRHFAKPKEPFFANAQY